MAEQVFYMGGNTGSTVAFVGPCRIVNFNSLTVPGSGDVVTIYDADRISDTSRPVAKFTGVVADSKFSLDVNLPCYRGIMVIETNIGSGRYIALVYEDDPDLEWGDRGYPA